MLAREEFDEWLMLDVGITLREDSVEDASLVATPSGESELYGVMRGSTGGLGVTTLLEVMGFAA